MKSLRHHIEAVRKEFQRLYPWSWALTLWCGLSLLFVAGQQSPVEEFLDQNFSQVIAFRLREGVKLTPPLDPRLKIYAFDDSMVELVGREDLSLKEWATLFAALAEAGASAIYIDKLFGTPEQLDQHLASFEVLMKDLKIPVITAGWLTDRPILGRVPLDPETRALPLSSLSQNPDAVPSWLRSGPDQVFYGPHILLHPFLRQVGHAIYRGQGEVDPLVRLRQDAFVPHWSLRGLHEPLLTQKGLWLRTLGDESVSVLPLNKRHRLPVNFLAEADLRNITYSLRKAYLRSQEGLSFAQSLQKGQVVVILPAMFTGNTDRVASPIGYIPGGYVMSSLLNSHLTKRWLKPWSFPELTIVIGVGLGVALGFVASPGLWLLGLLSGIAFIGTGSLLAFLYGSWQSNSLYHILAFVISGLFVFALLWQLRALRARSEAARRMAMHEAAQAVQVALLPPQVSYRGLRYASFYRAADATGGDWYGLYANLDHSRIYVFIGDVTGHGFSSALLTGTVAGALASQVEQCLAQPRPLTEELESMAQFVNRFVFATGSRTNRSLTMSFLAFDLQERVLTYLNAGHPPPYLARGSKVQALTARGSILGLQAEFQGECKTVGLESEDRLLLFTDGLWENTGPKGEVLKPRHVWEVLKQKDLSAEAQVEEILRLGRLQWKHNPPMDDCTFLVIHLQAWPS